MQVRRFYVTDIPAEGGSLELPAAEALHAGRVLRLRSGDSMVLLDGCGVRAQAVIDHPGRGRRFAGMTCRIQSRSRVAPPAARYRLCIAPPRPKQMSVIVRAATELGVWRITPIACGYGVAEPRAAAVHNWVEDAVTALKQSGNAFLPTIDPRRSFDEALAEASTQAVFGAIPEAGTEAAVPPCFDEGDVDVWVGPEGGFTAAEEAALRARTFQPVAIGRWVLRVETAVPALLGALHGKRTP